MVLTSSLPHVGGVYSRALKTRKSKYPPFPVGGGVMVTNDWCINTASEPQTRNPTDFDTNRAERVS